MKTFLKILAGIGAVIVIAIIAAMIMTSGMSDAADKFFSAVKSDDYDEAYLLLSDDFKSNTSKSQLQTYLSNNALTNFKETSWESRSVNGGRGELVGSITTESGGVVPISLAFVKGENDWKIYSIKKPSSGIQEETESVQLPSEREQVKLIVDSMNIFAISVNEKSMQKFHDHISYIWQTDFSVEKLDEAYGSLYNLEADLTVLNQQSPQFSTKAEISEEGVLVLAGHYPTTPTSVLFNQKYIYEGLSWKLIGFNMNFE